MRSGGATVFDTAALDRLIRTLRDVGYRTRGPVVRDGAILVGEVSGVSDLPVGWQDEQTPGSYRLSRRDDAQVFGWAVGPASCKPEFFPPDETLWRASSAGGTVELSEVDPADDTEPAALIGIRPCEVAAISVLDRVLMEATTPDAGYRRRRAGTFVVVAECAAPSGTCFCGPMGTGPRASGTYDIALTELDDEGGHRFLVRAGSSRGADLLTDIGGAEANDADLQSREVVLSSAESAMTGRIDTDDLPALLARNLEHPRWHEVAERCLACGNCTSVCPTCFCSDVRDTTDLAGTVSRHRRWASCFDLEHSYVHGGAVRKTTTSRYRQWMTHKLSTWWDQFGTSGCVGCGRCVTWCPVGIDITEEVAALRAADGVTSPGMGEP